MKYLQMIEAVLLPFVMVGISNWSNQIRNHADILP